MSWLHLCALVSGVCGCSFRIVKLRETQETEVKYYSLFFGVTYHSDNFVCTDPAPLHPLLQQLASAITYGVAMHRHKKDSLCEMWRSAVSACLLVQTDALSVSSG